MFKLNKNDKLKELQRRVQHLENAHLISNGKAIRLCEDTMRYLIRHLKTRTLISFTFDSDVEGYPTRYLDIDKSEIDSLIKFLQKIKKECS